ncbi:MAG: hypothetical protein J6J75_05235 [Alistipes sp.]|nr:hypothetical protein [Alistipes sp.]
MKKLFVLMAALFICNIVTAQVCQIRGTYDTIQVMGCDWNEGDTNIIVTLSNDSNSVAANVTVNATVYYKWVNDPGHIGSSPSKTQSTSGSEQVPPRSNNTKCYIQVPDGGRGRGGRYVAEKVKINSITGVKCQ